MLLLLLLQGRHLLSRFLHLSCPLRLTRINASCGAAFGHSRNKISLENALPISLRPPLEARFRRGGVEAPLLSSAAKLGVRPGSAYETAGSQPEP